ncbi:MAG: RNA polymerase sigma factor [Thermoleophilaceae bacterium]
MSRPPDNESLNRTADEELMPLVGEEVVQAFEIVYDRHGRAAFSLAFRILGDRGRAEDVVQEVFLSLWRTGARYDHSRGSVRTWILAMVRNRSIDSLRREAVQRVDRRESAEQILAAAPAAERTDAEAVRRDTAAHLQAAVDGLPEEQAQVVKLAYFGGFTHFEIAEMLDMPLGTVKGRMRLALEKMRGRIVEGLA